MWEWRRIGRHAPPLRTAAALLSALARPASAKTYYVNALCGDDANTGLKPGLAFATLQRAADKAAAGSTILVAPGVYAPLSTAKKPTVKSTAGKAQTAIDGGGAARCATLAAGTQLAGFTLQNGAADYTKKTGKFDLDSGARKVGKVDMGAYELQPQTAVPADYDGDGFTDAAFYFAASGQWWIFQSRDGLRTISLPDRNAVPCPADYDDEAGAEPAYFTAAAKEPAFVRVSLDGEVLERTAFGAKDATPVAAKLPGKTKATFSVYTANAKKPQFAFQNGRILVYGAKASRPVASDFDKDGKDDLGVYTATASKPAFSILQSSQDYATAKLFQGGPVALGAKGAIPCCADFDGDGLADFATYLSNAKAPYFQRLFSSSQFRETRMLPMGSKGDVPVVGVYEAPEPGKRPAAAPTVWTGSAWTYVDRSYADVDLDLLGE